MDRRPADPPEPTPATTPFAVRPLAPRIGAEIIGLDLRQALEAGVFAALRDAWHTHAILLFRGQNLNEVEQVRFAEHFGPLGKSVNRHDGHGAHPAAMYISNIRKDGKLIGALPDGEMMFHSDQCYTEQPCAGAMLYAMEIPAAGGNTLFASMYAAYEALPEAMKHRLDGLTAMNVYDYAQNPTQRGASTEAPHHAHPVVRTHPATGRKALYVNRLMTQRILGLPEGESAALLARLFDHQEQAAFVYEHVWRPGDLMMWDNRCTLHARTDFDASERRLLRRVVLLGDKPC